MIFRSPRLPSQPQRTFRGHEVTILLVLLLSAGLTTTIAFHAQRAVSSHQRVAQGALRDYAAFASWEIARKLDEATTRSLNSAVLHARLATEFSLHPVGQASAGGSSLGVFRDAMLQELSHCACRAAVHDFFAMNLESGAVARADPAGHAGLEEWLRTDVLAEARHAASSGVHHGAPLRGNPQVTVRTRADGPRPPPPPGGGVAIVRSADAGTRGLLMVRPLASIPESRLVYAIVREGHGGGTGAYGFVVSVPAYTAPIIREIVESADVLPRSLTRDLSNEEVLHVKVSTLEGHDLYRSTGHESTSHAVVDTLHTVLAPLRMEVAVRPEVASLLVIGGLPQSRLPALGMLLVLTLALLVIGTLQLRRQRTLGRLREGFVSGVSHELRTPLSQISMFAELLEDGRLNGVQRQRSIRIINEEAQRLRHLVENVLQFSRTGRNPRLSLVPTNVALLIQEVVESFRPLAERRKVVIHVETPAECTVSVDPYALRQVLLNLFDNAVKYGPEGQRIMVRLCRRPSWARISVEDEGPGIPPDERDEVWKPYGRLARDAASATAGSGIGLAVVRELVLLHGGSVRIDDGTAGGARIVIDLPA